MTLIVVVPVADTTIGLVYSVDDAVGVEPSVVYRMAAPLVVLDNVTVCVDVYVPPVGLMVGAATWENVKLNQPVSYARVFFS